MGKLVASAFVDESPDFCSRLQLETASFEVLRKRHRNHAMSAVIFGLSIQSSFEEGAQKKISKVNSKNRLHLEYLSTRSSK